MKITIVLKVNGTHVSKPIHLEVDDYETITIDLPMKLAIGPVEEPAVVLRRWGKESSS